MFSARVYLTNGCLACFDLVLTTICYFALREIEPGASRWSTTPQEAGFFLSFLLLWLALSSYFKMYRSRRMDSPLADFVVVFKVGMASWILVHLLSPLMPASELARLLPVRFLLVNCVALTSARAALRAGLRELRRRGHDVKRVLLVASEELGDRIEQKVERRAHYGYRVVKRFAYSGAADDNEGGVVERVRECLRSGRVDDVILALPAQASRLSEELVEACEDEGINVRIVPDLFPLIRTDTQIYDLDGIPLVNVRRYPTECFGYVVFKRAFDVCVSFLVLTLLSPLFVTLSLLIRATSAGPVFFTQSRVGMNGRAFRIIKFRTMHQNRSLNPDSHWTVDNDRHITALGRWLRRTNLDELPQFVNVLKGEMSIVGPRPERPLFLERFRREVPEYMVRHYVKSGITGWAQVNGWRGDTPIPQRVAHDLYYIRNWAVSLDIKILFLTLARTFFPVVPVSNESRPGSLRP